MEASTSASIRFVPTTHYLGSAFDSGHRTQLGFRSHRKGVLLITCGGKKRDTVDMAKSTMKKKLKLLKGLSSDLSTFQKLGFHEEDGSYAGKILEELSQLLMTQLQQLKAEKKEIKTKEKEDKLKMKALKKNMESVKTRESRWGNSSSALFPEQETERQLTEITNAVSLCLQTDPVVDDNGALTTKRECCVESNGNRIDVCMGGKCRKLGAAALLEELERKIGVEGSVVGCKCMGKCKTAPNIRLAEGMDSSATTPSNCVYTGVRLEDVDTIVSSFLGEVKENVGLQTPV